MSNTAPKVFIGLVTHEQTRFSAATTESGLATSLKKALSESGFECQLSIESRDLAQEHGITFSTADIKKSIQAELNLEAQWRSYLNPNVSKLRITIFMLLRKFYRSTKRKSDGIKMLNRLANIELAHLGLMQLGLDSHADWILILEDDAQSSDSHTLASSLMEFMCLQSELSQPLYVNLSKSFTKKELKTTGSLTEVRGWNDGDTSRIFSSNKSFTNTMCAILYRRYFLQELLNTLNGIELKPVVPIDWKVNKGLIELFYEGKLKAGDCWSVEPGPIIQGSMIND